MDKHIPTSLLFLILFYTPLSLSFLSPLHQWNCIGFTNNIDWSKPYKCNVGDIPLVVWKNKTDHPIATINICKHMGSTLHDGWLDNNKCVVCPYHGLKHTHKDADGCVVEHDGKLWWSMNTQSSPASAASAPSPASAPSLTNSPASPTIPPTIPYANNKDFHTSYLSFDMDESLPNCAYNSMDLNHPEYIHNNALGFGSNVSPQNYKYFDYKNIRDRVGIHFEYYLKKNIDTIHYDLNTNNHNSTKNFNMFIYPFTSWSCVTIGKQRSKMVIGVSMAPLSPEKTRWYVTIRHNYMKDLVGRNVVKMIARMILTQDKLQFKRQSMNKRLKKVFMMKKVLEHDEPILRLKEKFDNEYKYPTIDDYLLLNALNKDFENNANYFSGTDFYSTTEEYSTV